LLSINNERALNLEIKNTHLRLNKFTSPICFFTHALETNFHLAHMTGGYKEGKKGKKKRKEVSEWGKNGETATTDR
jgi:hypothetical protein